MTLTQERLKELLSYDPLTGVFLWLRGRHVGKQAGVISENGYRRIRVGPKRHMAHRLAWVYVHGTLPEQTVDHRDGNRDNNRIGNLRVASRSQQAMNTKLRVDNLTGLKGVHKRNDRSTFAAVIAVDGKQKTLGYFATPELAHAAYAAAVEIHFQEYGRLS